MMKKLLIVSLSIVFLTACGAKKEEVTQTTTKDNTFESSVNSEATADKGNADKTEVKANSRDNPNFDDNVKDFKEDLDNSQNEIWYFTRGDIAKDEKVGTYLVFNDQKVSIYELGNDSEKKTLGELSKMEDEDIISYVKAEREKLDVKDYQDHGNLLFSTKPVPYKISIKTDATGNKTAAEQIFADFEEDSTGDGTFFHYNFTMNSVQYLIYDQEYLGFEVGLNWENPSKGNNRTRLLRKRKSENDLILMDQPTTEGIEVDGE